MAVSSKPLDEWLGTYGHQIDDVRKALDWAFSPSGDPKLGVALAAAALPLWMHLSLMNECRSRVEQAISCLPSGPDRSPRLEMQLFQALGAVLLTIEDSGFAAESALRRALGIAESLDETDYQLRILWCSWAHALNRGAFSEALALADRFRHLATRSTDLFDPLNGERMRGFALHFLGDQDCCNHFGGNRRRCRVDVDESGLSRWNGDLRGDFFCRSPDVCQHRAV